LATAEVLVDAPVEEAPAEGDGGTVLLADDNQAVLKIVQAVLERLGYEVIQAMDGKQAVAMYKEQRARIRLVILDVVMPSMGGIAAAQAIRTLDADAKIIFMTGYDPNQQFNGDDMVGEEVVLKPFKVGAFSQLVKAALER
jgi:CheY-like chemotaxis protein